MNPFMITLLSLSLSGAILIAIIYLTKPLYKERLSKRWQYYIWLIVIARLLLPFSLEFNLVGRLFNDVIPVSITHAIVDGFSEDMMIENGNITSATNGEIPTEIPTEVPITSSNTVGQQTIDHSLVGIFESDAQLYSQSYPQPYSQSNISNIINTIFSNIWIIWIVAAIALFVRKITIYQSFVRFVKAGRKPVEDIESLEHFGKILEQAGIKGTVGFYTNNLVSSPLLIGFFRPFIVLPSLNISESDFKYTILHELTHYRRGDMFYKWLVQLTICLHWFNPLVYVMGNEINKACEFSCDESVIKDLDENAVKSYGDTLLGAIGITGTYKNSLSAIGLSGNIKILKERLDMIKYFEKKSRLAIITALLAALALSIGAMVIGAYARPIQAHGSSQDNTHEVIGEVVNDTQDDLYPDTVINIHSNNRNNVVFSGSFAADDNQVLILQITSSIQGGSVDLFLFAPDGTEHRFTVGATSLTERVVTLAYGVWAYTVFGQFRSGDVSIVGTTKSAQLDSQASPSLTPPLLPTLPPLLTPPPLPTLPPSPTPPSLPAIPHSPAPSSLPTPSPSPTPPPSSTPPSQTPPQLPTPSPCPAIPDINWFGMGQNWNWNPIGLQGIGEMIPLTFQTENFTGIDINLPANVTWRSAPDASVTVTMQENFFEYLSLYVRDGNLVIYSRTQLAIGDILQNRPIIYIYAPYINNVAFTSAVDTVNWDTIYSEHFTIKASGAVDIILDLQVDVLDVDGSGAADLILSGNADTANISVSGAVDFLSFDLQISNANLIVSGAADVQISVSNTLSLNVSGAADVQYSGNPTITRNNVSGGARVIQVQ